MTPCVARHKWVEVFSQIFKGAVYGNVPRKSADCYLIMPDDLIQEHKEGWLAYAGDDDDSSSEADDALVNDVGGAFRIKFSEDLLQSRMKL